MDIDKARIQKREILSFFSTDNALKLDPRSITTDKRTFSFTYGQPLLKLYIHIYIFDYRYILFFFLYAVMSDYDYD